MVRVTLDGRVEHCFRLLNSRRKCEFLGFFPEEGATQSDLTEAEIFNSNKSVVHYYLEPYRSFFNFERKEDDFHFKLMTLNESGQDLQKITRYMILIDYELNEKKRNKIDYLTIFLERGNPKRMLQVISKIYFNGARTVNTLSRFRGDRNTKKLVERLEDFGLVKTRVVQERRKQTYINHTALGQKYFYRLFLPVIEYITASCEPVNCELYQYVVKHWDTFVNKKGNGWADKLKAV
ncbi:MAG: hypothetical protein KAT77_04135 [Nanoarchaeota archaeon]|nr:hypothetical protein [Nanoarchaeota archaeon]